MKTDPLRAPTTFPPSLFFSHSFWIAVPNKIPAISALCQALSGKKLTILTKGIWPKWGILEDHWGIMSKIPFEETRKGKTKQWKSMVTCEKAPKNPSHNPRLFLKREAILDFFWRERLDITCESLIGRNCIFMEEGKEPALWAPEYS